MSAVEDDLRGELESAFAAQREAEPVEAAEVVETPPEDSGRERDEKGRFVSKGADTDDAPAPAVESVADQPADKPIEPEKAEGTETTQPLAQALAPPNGWSAEAKAKWHELPAEIQAAVNKREQDVTKFTSTRDEHASFGKEIYQAVQPYMPIIKAEGGTPKAAIETLLNTAYVLRTGSQEQKQKALVSIAQTYGIPIPNGQAAEPGDLSAVESRFAELENKFTAREREELQRVQTEIQREISAFAADPSHTYFETVKAYMAALLQVGVVKDMQDAYKQACWAHPDIRATLTAQERAAEEQKRKADAAERAKAAQRKAISITGGPGSTAAKPASEARSLREELEAQFAASSGAV